MITLPQGCVEECPACAHRYLSSVQSAEQKQTWLSQRLAPWQGQLHAIETVDASRHLGYRDKVSLSCQFIEGQWQFGVFRRDEFIAIPQCPIHSERVQTTIALLQQQLPHHQQNFQLAFFAQTGAQVVLIFKQAQRPTSDWLTPELQTKLKNTGVEALWLHCYPAAGRHLFSKNAWYKVWGKNRSIDEAGFYYGPAAFNQLLPDLHARSLKQAHTFLNPSRNDYVMDLYCGRGLSLARWQQSGARCIGVETGAESLACARLNAPQATLLRGSCEHRLPQLEQWWQSTPIKHRLAYINPPRTGLEPKVGQWLADTGRPTRIAYLSCSAGTLARDLEQLCAAGYQVQGITPYDFFPRTYHVETLSLLSLTS